MFHRTGRRHIDHSTAPLCQAATAGVVGRASNPTNVTDFTNPRSATNATTAASDWRFDVVEFRNRFFSEIQDNL
jgi:hypothetical protein